MPVSIKNDVGDLTIVHEQGASDLTVNTTQLGGLERMIAEQNRTWQNVTGQRAAEVLYLNDTGHDIFVSAMVNSADNQLKRFTLLVDGVAVASTSEIDSAVSPTYVGTQVNGVVPNGSEYTVLRAGFGSYTIANWSELR